jgi:predicted nucleic acid-binding protein
MKDKAFIDSNLFIYSYTDVLPEKQATARKLIEELPQIFISTQVLNEFINIMLKKMKIPWDVITGNLQEIIENTQVKTISAQTVLKACNIADKYNFSYYDSLIIAAALEVGCNTLYSEDMHHNQLIENKLKIVNPFI